MLTILATHPIQYQVPLWREATNRLQGRAEVWYLSDRGHREAFDRGFGRTIGWDIDLLGGYAHRFPGGRVSHPYTFNGMRAQWIDRELRTSGTSALLVNGWFPRAYWDAVAAAHRIGIPVLLRAETNDIRRPSAPRALVRRHALRWLFTRVSCFLTIGRANARFYRAFGVPADRLVSSPYGVDNRRFMDAAENLLPDRQALRRRWSIPEDGTCFLFCGKFTPKKRVGDLLDAFERLAAAARPGVPPVHLLLVGDGEQMIDVERRMTRIAERAGRRCITIAGFLNQSAMPEAYVAADCLVLPSDAGETWGLVVNEAMACGVPAVVSDQVGCAEDLIVEGITGSTFRTGDVEGLVSALQRWSDFRVCAAARAAVRRRVAEYSIERAADGLVQAYGEVASALQSAAV